jgi:fructokinase
MTDPRTALCAGYMPLDVVDREGEVWRRAGGTAGNVAAILAFLGWDSALAGRVGDDRAGDEMLHDLGRAGVDCSLIDRDPGGLTNRLIHSIDASGHRYAFSCPNCGQKLPRSRPLRLERLERIQLSRPRPDVFFFDRANPATVALAEAFSQVGSLVVYEPSTPASAALLERAIGAAGIVKGSVEHGPGLVESYAAGKSNQVRVITEGAAGARFRIGEGEWRTVGVYPVSELDASGAGDWTTAGMLHRLKGTPPASAIELVEAIQFGHALAALNCAVPGARGLMEGRSRASVLGMVTRIQRGEPRLPIASKHPVVEASSGQCDWCLLPTATRSDAAGGLAR